jgi:hypothetical protein
VRLHHAEGLLDPQAECTSHTPGNMTAQGPEATRHGAPCLPGTLVDARHASRAAYCKTPSSCWEES